MRIYLVGFMGSGKSTLGHKVANIAEAHAGMTIPELFETYGETYFRHIEADILRQTTIYPKSLIATGGGLPCFEDNMAWMTQNGITMYLQWPDELLRQHLLPQRESRPLISALNDSDASLKISELLTLRKPYYEQAAITIEMTDDESENTKRLERACKYIW
jgi:shikimate kinase